MKNKLLEIFNVAYETSAITRYSQTHLVKEESVLEHTGFVVLLSYYFAENLIEEGHKIDIGVLLSKAVVHDIDETITGDMPHYTKYDSKEFRESVEKIERKNMKTICKKLGSASMYELWVNAKKGKEGAIIYLCDRLSIVYKIWNESLMFGNKTLNKNICAIRKNLTTMYATMESTFGVSLFLYNVIKTAIVLCDEIESGELIWTR